MEQNNRSEYAPPRPRRRWTIIRVVGLAVIGVAFAALMALIFGFLVKWLWNWLMPDIFGLAPISYWQAFGLILLAKLFFGGFGHPHSDSRYADRFKQWAMSNHGDHWKPYTRFWREKGQGAAEALIDRVRTEKPGEG
jgi:hypothetical protein